jgi:uncharacterized protein (TIGR02118 family)
MFKAMILLTRRDDLSREEFVRWWLEEHRPMALGLPKLRRMVINLVDEGPDGGIDGVSELWFDSHEDFVAAYATDHGKAVAANTMAQVSSRVRYFVTEHE